MKNKTKMIIVLLALLVFMATIGVMLGLALKPSNDTESYKHISYGVWLKDETTTSQHYSLFNIDEANRQILATSAAKGTYIIDMPTSGIASLTAVDSSGVYTSSVMTSLNGIGLKDINVSFNSLSIEKDSLNLGLWISLSMLSVGSMMISLTMLRMSNKK